jgi:hypothetical protein
MAKFRIDYQAITKRVCYVEADSCMEAKQKFLDFEEVIEDYEDYGIDINIQDIYED